LEEFRRHLQDVYGIEYADWHAQCAVEIAMKRPLALLTLPPGHHQFFIAGCIPSITL